MFVRFESHYRHQCTRWGTGLFHMLPEVLDKPNVTADTRSRVAALRQWFNENLPAPRQSIDPRAIFWFRAKMDLGEPRRVSPWKRRPLTKLAARMPRLQVPSNRPVDTTPAAAAIDKMREFVDVIRDADLHINIVETTRPGYIIYEDPCQVAAIPFRDAIAEKQRSLEN